ncbi:hypothetical protein OF83DRAFT_153456 [Amylostereum chailletii]|nr:hypothetical protein OF83DRAFT_153456 [Amylostereum chailletii]
MTMIKPSSRTNCIMIFKELRDLKLALSICLKRIQALVHSNDGFIRRLMRKKSIRSEIDSVRKTVDRCYRQFLVSAAIVTAQGVGIVRDKTAQDLQNLVSVLRQEIRFCFRDAMEAQPKGVLADETTSGSSKPPSSSRGKFYRPPPSNLKMRGHDKDRLEVQVDALIGATARTSPPITRASSSSSESTASSHQGHPVIISPVFPSPEAATKSLQLLDKISGNECDPQVLARSLAELAILLSDLGLARSACQVAGKSVDVHYSLVQQDISSSRAPYARSLSTHAALLMQMKMDPQLAYASSEKAVALLRELQRESPGKFEASLASALNNHSNALCIIGRHSQALQAILQSVDIRRRLVSRGSHDLSASLSHSLHNLASCVMDVEDRQEAVHIMTEATDIARVLAHEDSVFDEASATCLLTLSHCLVHVGRSRDALVAARKCIGIRQTAYSKETVARRAPLLSEAYSQLSICYKATKDYSEALHAIKQAVFLDRSHIAETQGNPDSFVEACDMLAFDLYRLSMRFADLGRKKEAIEAMEESIEHRERIVQAEPDADLAVALHDLAVLYFNTARYVEAKVAARRAVIIRRTLASADWVKYGPLLRNSVRVLEKIRLVVQ